jgi:hypothetical protein
MSEAEYMAPKASVSYAWEDEAHNRWVRELDLLPDVHALVQHQFLGKVPSVALLGHEPSFPSQPYEEPAALLSRSSVALPRARTQPTTRAPVP